MRLRAVMAEVDPRRDRDADGLQKIAAENLTVGVAITPGLDFGHHRPEAHVRLAYTIAMPKLEDGVERLRRFVGSR